MLLLFAISALIGSATACGGFFCSLQQPVVQDGENILFTMSGRNVKATVQIRYSGEAEDFSWVLPLPSTPSAFDVSSDRLFSALHSATDPTFRLNVEWPKDCASLADVEPCQVPLAVPMAAGGNESAGAVEVVAEGEVGPFVYQVILARKEDTEGDDLFAWLNDNGFDQPPAAKPIVARYVKNRHRFVTLKLQKGKTAGELVPIVLEYESPSEAEMSCVPLRLTAIAANEDMPVFVWVAGETRAVPNNFIHLKPDLSQMDWSCAYSSGLGRFGGGGASPFPGGGPVFNPFGVTSRCTTVYQDLLKATAEEYGIGRWMTTEFAGKADENLLNQIWNDATSQFDVSAYTGKTAAEFIQLLFQQLGSLGLQRVPQTTQLLRDIFPKPDDVDTACESDRSFYGTFNNMCLDKYVSDFDPVAAAKKFEDALIVPLSSARKDLEQNPYLTRLYTAISPEFMDRDPIFRFAPKGNDLGDVSNAHSTKLVLECPATKDAAFNGEYLFENGKKTAIEGLKLGGCGQTLIFPGGEPPVIAFDDAQFQLLRTTGSVAEPTLEVMPLADKAAAQALDATLEDEVVGLDFDQCNPGSKDCTCGDNSTCSAGLECRDEVCKMPISDDDDDKKDMNTSAITALALTTTLAAFVAHF